MNPKFWLRLPVRRPESVDDHARNWEQVDSTFKALPFGSGVAKYLVEAPSGIGDYTSVPNFAATWTPLPFNLLGTGVKSETQDGRFTTSGYMVVEGGWWEFHWATWVSGSGAGYGIASILRFYRDNGSGFVVGAVPDERGWQGHTDASFGAITNSSAMVFLAKNTLVKVELGQNSGSAKNIGIWHFTARRVLEEA